MNIDLLTLAAVAVATLLPGGCVLAAARRRRATLAADLHELRQALTAARLMVDLTSALEVSSAEASLLAADELGRAYRSLIEFEQLLHLPLLRLPLRGRSARRRPRAAEISAPRGAFEARTELERLVKIWGQAAAVLGRTLEFEWTGGHVVVAGARRRFAEVVTNLLSNAIRHGEGSIRLAARARDGVLRIDVSDQGPGLSRPVAALASRRSGLFGKLGPHGHGLAVAVRAAQALGGGITSAPSAGGATLVLELPVYGAETSPGRVGPREGGSEGSGTRASVPGVFDRRPVGGPREDS